MKIGEFELADPLPELNRPIAIAMLRPWIDVGTSRGHSPSTSCNAIWARRSWGDLPSLESSSTLPGTGPRNAHRQRRARFFTTPNSIIHYAHDDSTDRGLPVSCTSGSRTISERRIAALFPRCCLTSTFRNTVASAACTTPCRTRGLCW